MKRKSPIHKTSPLKLKKEELITNLLEHVHVLILETKEVKDVEKEVLGVNQG